MSNQDSNTQNFLRENASPVSRRRLLQMTAGGVVAALSGSAFAGCGSNTSPGPSSSLNTGDIVYGGTTTYGPDVPLGDGVTRAYVTQQGGKPIRVGVEFTPGGLTNLPSPPAGQLAAEIKMESPPELTALTPYLTTRMFYSPGHPPVGNQDVPHIHPSWYLISDADRLQITPDAPGAFTAPDAEHLPANHITGGAGAFINGVGNLFIDPVTPGYRQTPFSTTEYEYRFFNGSMILLGLGIAMSFFPGKQDSIGTLAQPQKYPKPGYYPTTYRVRFNKDRGVYDMSIENFVLR